MRNIVFLLFVLLSVRGSAQSPTDSIYLQQSSRLQFQSIRLGMPQLLQSEVLKSTKVGLDFDYNSGGFRPAQLAETQKRAQFEAEGISTLNRIKLYGFFGFNRTWQDSLAFSQKGLEESFSPYYFIAKKAGKFERQGYKGQGLISYEVLKNKLYLGTAVDYLYHTSNRSVDPRSSVTSFQLKFVPQITYRLKEHLIGLGLRLGYGDETVEIAYKNDNFQGTLLYPDRISYLNLGYGYLEINQTNFVRKYAYSGLDFNYAGTLLDWTSTGQISYHVDETENKYVLTNSATDNVFGSFQLASLSANWLMQKRHNTSSSTIALQYEQRTGDDNFRRLAARNFTYEASTIAGNYVYAKLNESKLQYEWNLGLKYHSTYQRDAAANHTIEYAYLNPNLSYHKYWQNGFAAQLGIGARIPLDNYLNVPTTQENIFTKGVVYPDHLYWASHVGTANLGLNYTTDKLIANYKTGLTLQTQYQYKISSPEMNFVPTFVPANQRLNFNIGFNLYF